MNPIRFAIVSFLFLVGRPTFAGEPAEAPGTRPFHLGFTRWPADLSLEGIRIAVDFAHQHGDIVSVMFIGGIPWPEALEGRPFSRNVEDDFAYRPPNGAKIFLSISPLNRDRKGLAPYWGEKDNLPLPAPWDTRPLNSPEVKRAYLNFTERAIRAMHPDYLAIGIELNVLLSNDPAKWKQIKELYRETYRAVKAEHPTLPVFFTTEVVHYQKLAREARDKDQAGEVADLMRFSDLFAMSIYPHMTFDIPRPIPAELLDFAVQFRKPIALAESGMTSRDVELKSFHLTLRGTEEDQRRFTEQLLRAAARDRYEFVVTFATTDFERLCARLPAPVNDIARIWAYTGMQTAEGKAKPALAVWDAWLKLKYQR